MILEKREYLRKQHSLEIVVTGVIDIDYTILDDSEKGLNLKELLSLKKVELLDRTVNLTFEEVLQKYPFDIAVELTPSTNDAQPGLDHIQKAFHANKHVVTSNKSPLVLKFHELRELAEKNNCEFRFESTVCGVIPLFTSVKTGLSANEIEKIEGILNGTTNFILTRMSEGTKYAPALEDAKKLGFAETNPHDDISGLDAARKLVIIANVLMNSHLTLDEVEITGIDSFSSREWNYECRPCLY